jgi:hypothetical protein
VDSASPKAPDDSADKPAPPKPEGVWGTILTTTPIVLTILATAFAGLSSSEMTQAMYFRSLAAQHQSKAGDQWAFFQAKRVRGTSLEMTAELLHTLAPPDPFDPAEVEAVSAHVFHLLERAAGAGGAQRKAAADAAAKVQQARAKLAGLLADARTSQALPHLTGAALPKVEVRPLPRDEARQALDDAVRAIRRRQTEAETTGVVGRLKPDDVEEATRLAEEDADRFDKACEPVGDTLKAFRAVLGELNAAVRPFRKPPAGRADDRSRLAEVPASVDRLSTSFKAAALDFEARRYRQEASFNRKAAELYEVRVRRSGVESDRHRERSKKFFYSMLIAQLGVTVSSLALARAQRSTLWLLAALAGLTALGFSGYVYVSY